MKMPFKSKELFHYCKLTCLVTWVTAESDTCIDHVTADALGVSPLEATKDWSDIPVS